MSLRSRFLIGLADFGDRLGSVGMLWGAGIGAVLTLIMGKLFIALILAALALGIFIRLKRGRIDK